MAKYVSKDNLTYYDGKIKSHITNEIAASVVSIEPVTNTEIDALFVTSE